MNYILRAAECSKEAEDINSTDSTGRFSSSGDYFAQRRLMNSVSAKTLSSSSRHTSDTNASKRIPCPKCGRGFAVKGSMTRHFKFECGQEPRFQCPYCDVRSKQTSYILAHVRKRHPGKRVYVLDILF